MVPMSSVSSAYQSSVSLSSDDARKSLPFVAGFQVFGRGRFWVFANNQKGYLYAGQSRAWLLSEERVNGILTAHEARYLYSHRDNFLFSYRKTFLEPNK